MNYKQLSGYVGTVASGISLANALGLVGLQKRQNPILATLPALGAFGIGITVGAGLGLLFAPKPGARLRDDIGRKVNRLAEDIKKTAEKAEASVQKTPARAEFAEVNGH